MYYWNSWYTGWGWFLWYGVFLLFFLNVGNWGYTYRAHRRFGETSAKDAMDFLNERYARGDIKQEEYFQMKSHISTEVEERVGRSRSPKSTTSLQPNF